VKNKDGDIYIFVYQLDNPTGKDSKDLSFSFKGKLSGTSLPSGVYQKEFYGISDNDLVGSAYNKWFDLGAPENPTEVEVAELSQADDLKLISEETLLHCPLCGDNMQDVDLSSLGTTNAVGLFAVLKKTGVCPPGCEYLPEF